MSNTKTASKLFIISQNRPTLVNFLIFLDGPWPTLAHEGLCPCAPTLKFSNLFINNNLVWWFDYFLVMEYIYQQRGVK